MPGDRFNRILLKQYTLFCKYILSTCKRADKWYQWALAIALYAWICLGISFIYINSIGYHHQAVRVGAIFFGIVAIAWGFVVARTLGFIGKKREA